MSAYSGLTRVERVAQMLCLFLAGVTFGAGYPWNTLGLVAIAYGGGYAISWLRHKERDYRMQIEARR